jgi:hypothetical protein
MPHSTRRPAARRSIGISLRGPGIEYTRGDGLTVRFLARENVADCGVVQFAVVEPGHYRLTLDADAEHLTTDQGVFVEITDAEHPERMRATSVPLLGAVPRAATTLDVTFPEHTQIVRVRLARTPSLKFDNQIGGELRIHHLSLTPR